MKFGKYLAARQLELPEYSGHCINYKALKKLINALVANNNNNNDQSLQDKKGSFFFRLERELEKVNDFYLEKEAELKFRLDILVERKNKALADGRLDNVTKNSIAFVTLYDGLKKFSKDLDRLEQFVELNETGFTKVLKKWDKRSKSRTKELYLSTAVNVQPVFHRDQIIELSDLVANNLMELEAKVEGGGFVRYETKDTVRNDDAELDKGDRESDELYTDFYEIIAQNANRAKDEQVSKLHEWVNQVLSKLSPDNKKFTISKVFLLLIPNLQIPDEALKYFYDNFKQFIDIHLVDDLNGRTCLHEAASCKTGRVATVKLCLENNIDPTLKDVTGRTCLHYITENGRDDLLLLVLEYAPKIKPLSNLIDVMDNESISPLLMAIINNHVSSVDILLKHGSNAFPQQDDLKPKYLPLNVACKTGNLQVVQLLLNQVSTPAQAKEMGLLTKSFQSNAEGLLPLHIVASSGHDELLALLLQYGADVNQLDKLNKWTPIFYSAIKGYASTTQKLIEYGADFDVKDEDGLNPLYYAIWEGNVGAINVLIESFKSKSSGVEPVQESSAELAPPKAPSLSFTKNVMSPMVPTPSEDLPSLAELSNVDMIPDLSLPPPIIPLRKYGHNFLEKKIFLKLSFYTSRNSIKLNPDTFLTSIPGRITISCDKNDLIPRNLLLPVLDNEKSITFQTDTFDDFAVDFELFPTFGTRLIAKSTLPSTLFQSLYPGVGSKLSGDLEIPLFDLRLRNIGSLKFNYEVVYPYSGIPLEISMYDTYWKSSSSAAAVKSISFVTASSLSGEYYRVKVCFLGDGTPLVCPSWEVNFNGVQLPVCTFDFAQLQKILYSPNEYESLCLQLRQVNSLKSDLKSLEEIMSKLYIPLESFLQNVCVDISLNLEIFYPSVFELKFFDMKCYSVSAQKLVSKCEATNLNPITDNVLNNYIDLILKDVFTHVRALRTEGERHRSLILSSDNAMVCTILNWKQPNYPVFYNINGIKYNFATHRFEPCSSNGFSTSDIQICETRTTELNIENVDSINKDSAVYLNDLQYQDQLTRSIKLAINFATTNNLLGLIIPNGILSICPDLIKSVRSKGLILVASKERDTTDDLEFEFIKSADKLSDTEIDVNGLRFNDILSFKDAIDM
ncbi:hypothetical protein OGAPHI_003331 [Ogataea philodendri]|uniref:Phosphate system positive regulatory protein PHO81 n=1 Tax=Ogataea philodendri TaxID=1378263 RepID=A0A9P8P8Q7_9ASCO|nr:uncharacterized protein OGAPHI_003331 [Ogataea philodendri]KAH3666882.1 hypothetical protein OGAPHI_003331 [Ogataea philodendri]